MANALSGSGVTTDLYLLLFTKLVIGSVRFTWLFAAFYSTFWITFATSVSYFFYGPESYDAQQAPLRVIFLVGTAVLAIRLVAKLGRERKTADLLRAESEAVAEIGSLVSSTLEFDDVFPRFARRMREMAPFHRLALAFVNGGGESMKLSHSYAEQVQPWLTGRDLLVPQVMRRSIFSEMRPVIFGEGECALIRTSTQGAISSETDVVRSASGSDMPTKSLIVTPVMRKGEIVALLLAGSCNADAFTPAQAELLGKVGAHIGGAIASAQLYQRTLQLTEEQVVRERLDAENRELQRVNEAKSSLVAFVSHELRTPLTSIIAHKDILLRRREGMGERQLRSLNAIGGSAELLNDLISDLLDMSKIESGRLELSPEPVEVGALIDGIKATFEPVLNGRSQNLVISRDPAVETVYADRRKLVQVLNNLVSNASKYSPEGRRVTCDIRTDGENVLFEVADQGIGISEEDQKQLFTPFYRSPDPAARKQSGTGLGLVVSRGIVMGHGGTMTVRSAHRVGTTVSFTIPCHPAGAVAQEAA
jgi:signal transduction histidine kinase